MHSINFFVEGDPKPQPRPRAFALRGRARVYNPATAEGWKGRIALESSGYEPSEPHRAGVSVTLTFWMRRPKSHYGSGSRAQVLKPSAPARHLGKPDVDNLEKAVLDAMTTIGFWRDDSQIVELCSRKLYAIDRSGADISVRFLDLTQLPKEPRR